jgi:hypothetical protein
VKTQHLIPIIFLAACCAVSAQTNTPPKPAMLTEKEAVTLAIKLGNKAFKERYINTGRWSGREEIYSTNAVLNYVAQNYGTKIQSSFDGHWVISLSMEAALGMYNNARVDIAPDGSTNSVKFTRVAVAP